MRDDRFVTVAEQSQEQREEEFYDRQRREAEREQARRARQMLENLRQMEIRNARKAAGRCLFFGRPRNAMARFFGATRHRRCRSFT